MVIISPRRSSTHLVVIGERNDASTDTENHTWMDLAVSPRVRVDSSL